MNRVKWPIDRIEYDSFYQLLLFKSYEIEIGNCITLAIKFRLCLPLRGAPICSNRLLFVFSETLNYLLDSLNLIDIENSCCVITTLIFA